LRIWIDGDACPNKIKEIVFRAATRTKTEVIIVANHLAHIPSSPFIKRLQVESGFDVADDKIAESISINDLVVTADIPLASEVVAKKAWALNPRGELYSESNIKQKRAMRDFNESLRESGMLNSKTAKLNSTDIRRFANILDTILRKNTKKL